MSSITSNLYVLAAHVVEWDMLVGAEHVWSELVLEKPVHCELGDGGDLVHVVE